MRKLVQTMKTQNRNKQKMYYALIDGLQPVYQRDSNGNIEYTVIDGVSKPIKTGDYEVGYSTPVEFYANISSTLASAAFKPFGIDNSANMATICCNKDYIPLEIGAIIWRKSEIEYLDDEETIPDSSSADFVVKGIATEGLTNDLYLLQRLSGSVNR